ncbi:hypothetical protein PoMZ_03809 [Pyricularia oryzae]|uniref:F-box domain-containing protein n=1 Tax=Pyricularia oryzae TaxID=318829 RepID=A0A4P7NBM6_PYROR|nr:hypothetical protein PoMZ_03809 [Pyricularia oryzae]
MFSSWTVNKDQMAFIRHQRETIAWAGNCIDEALKACPLKLNSIQVPVAFLLRFRGGDGDDDDERLRAPIDRQFLRVRSSLQPQDPTSLAASPSVQCATRNTHNRISSSNRPACKATHHGSLHRRQKGAFRFSTYPRKCKRTSLHSDLICLSLVSKHFRELAAAQLYRNFHIVFPDEDDPAYDSPIDGLAGGLDTFVTSDYDYGKHLRDLSLDTLSAGDKAETAYKPYLYSVSCGKFMNTLLQLTLRKAKSLEAFTWNIRVELSRPVYKTLHSIPTLKDVHIRLQLGPSLYDIPPPLPLSSSQISGSPPTYGHAGMDGMGLQPLPPQVSIFGGGPPPPPPQPVYYMNSVPMQVVTASVPQSHKPLSLRSKAKKQSLAKEPPTFSGFKKLRSLAVLDMDTLEAVSEIRTCIRNSSSTLTKLKLSFSDHLAAQARKPSADSELDDSDQEDEFQVMPGHSQPPPPAHYADSSLSIPARAFRAAEERKSQEAVLGRIFDVEPYLARKSLKRASPKTTGSEAENSQEAIVDAGLTPAEAFVNSLKLASTRLHNNINRSSGQRAELTVAQQEIVDLIGAAARKYVAEVSTEPKDEDQQAVESSSGAATPKTEESTAASAPAPAPALGEPGSSTENLEPFKRSVTAAKETRPEDINIEEPEGQLNLDGQDTPIALTGSGTDTPVDSSSQQVSKCTTASTGEVGGITKEPRAEVAIPVEEEKATIPGQHEETLKKALGKLVAPEDQDRCISEYIRSTRGLRLQQLSIYLIPVKASVISKAIDVHVLRKITLLNVGPQQSIWTLFAKENKSRPLPLRKIFTDNVSPALLNFVSQLEELHEFFILERDHKYKPESFAAKTVTTIEQIRKLVLRKHLPTLKRLMIKNMDSQDWDIDEQTMKLICRKGKLLEELAVSMNIRAIHTFMQNMGGLVNLIALLIIRLRNEDTCVWVMRETKKFFLDNLSHHPEMKLEWLSIDDEDQLEKLVRITHDSKKGKKSKSKGKEPAHVFHSHNDDLFPHLSVDSWDGKSDSCSEEDSDDDDDDDDNGRPKVKLETIDGVHFYDVWGIKIFQKEIVSGRL